MSQKLEHMTHLHGDTLVEKSHPRILFRGKLDSLIALVMLTRCELEIYSAELDEIQEVLQSLMRAEVLDTPVVCDTLFGQSFDELRAESHALYAAKPVASKAYALLNVLRTAVRETELAAVMAFGEERADIVRALNRLSSGVYVLMCRG